LLESILIKNIAIVFEKEIKTGDIYIHQGKIKYFSWSLNMKAEEVINGQGLMLIPGCIDTHVHMRDFDLAAKEDFNSGSRAAAAGGFTTIFDMPNTQPPTISLEALAQKRKQAAANCLVNYGFYLGATKDNLAELNKAENIAGIKIFMGSSTGNLLLEKTADLEKIFTHTDKLITVHAEDHGIIMENTQKSMCEQGLYLHAKIRSKEAEITAIEKALKLAKVHAKRLHILHLTCAESVALLRKEKIEGLITAEVCPQHLFLHGPEAYEKLGNFAKVNPPIRMQKDSLALWQGLKEGVIDFVSTDHAPHTIQEKMQPYQEAPSGMPGLETALPLMLNQVNTEKCSMYEIVRWFSQNQVKAFNIPNKGYIREGYDADLTLIDLKTKRQVVNQKLQTKCKWSAFDGQILQGWPIMTIVNGQIVYREGDVFSEAKGREVKLV
jgi:dihydroorotase